MMLFLCLLWYVVNMHQSISSAGVSSNPGVPSVIQLKNTDESVQIDNNIQTKHKFEIVGDEFVLDGRQLRLLSGSLHYFRLPAAYWRDRLRKLKAAGLNAVSTYVEWSYHEPEERQYLFEGDRDVARFVQVAAEEGLHVLLRPGPYICAERDLGGLPYWLLSKYPQIKLRSIDADFIKETKIWMEKLFSYLSPLLVGNGGPIIMVQVENEFGSYNRSRDKSYMMTIRDTILEHVGTKAVLYTTDGTGSCTSGLFVFGSVPGALTTIDFGDRNDVRREAASLRCFMPKGPLMNSEYYPGWLTHWSESMQRVPTSSVVSTLQTMLNNNFSVNFYMFFGGTNFEFSSGANHNGVMYQPDITSYDYDAPLSEAGDPTPKYFAIREILKQYNPQSESGPLPTPSEKGNYGTVTLHKRVSLLSPEGRTLLGKKYDEVTGSKLPTFEELRQRAGLLLYETAIKEESGGLLYIGKLHDRAYVYVDGDYQGYLSRSYGIFSVPIKTKNNSVLSILVENQGRINYGPLLHDFKGILSEVIYNYEVLSGKWTVTGYPLEKVNVYSGSPGNGSASQGPVLYDGNFILPEGKEPLDTFLDTTDWGKGYIWINGYNIGRYWPKTGPQVTLYVPGVWLKEAPAQNYIQVLELEESPVTHLTMNFRNYPILNGTSSYY